MHERSNPQEGKGRLEKSSKHPGGAAMNFHKVALFVPCLIDAMYPEVAQAMVRVLKRLAIQLEYPTGQTCCGQPAYNSGYWSAARKAARHFIEVFETAGCIVSPSGSCVHMIRHHYARLFCDQPRWLARARALAGKTFELCEYLVDMLGASDLGAAYYGSVTYHDSCHLRYGLNVAHQPRQLIRKVRGLQLIEMAQADRCCGFGGTFAVKYPAISTAMVDEKIRLILESGADAVVGADMGCLMNIEGRLRRLGRDLPVLHMAQLLDGAD
jgi:L-lactate dehydrogenase complex protein LldE